ncbi:hypothetical protein L211DRAFT_832532 [Terfezia boudieri ATCC MYA-4762]|uniref:Uncharacterized protein n=1 Tax=Terfezia boudieri ATCC MYA-4762 TaxID=1051890 RepID=A0A3N4M3U0_9PEZI|nr:hypothetical protein L211DRAFT_832532 [Terfezia boudieri ATCC MYA-4762]
MASKCSSEFSVDSPFKIRLIEIASSSKMYGDDIDVLDVLDAYNYEYPETAFLALFRMHRILRPSGSLLNY